MSGPIIREMTDEKFREIYTDKELRNQVAHAHRCMTAFPNSVFKHSQTCSWPVSWIVSADQIKKAQDELKRAKVETIKATKGKLVLVAMGSSYVARYRDDVCNHRARGTFLNNEGETCFVEVSAWDNPTINVEHLTAVTFAMINYQSENEFSLMIERDYQSLRFKYTRENVLKIVNHWFGCDFRELYIDEFDLSPDDVISKAGEGKE